MGARVGTSGWSYAEWKGPFYPEDIASGDMLAYYADRLNAVEVNNTFYRLPKKDVVRGWSEQTPDDFSFVLKASRRITHQAKLGPDAVDPLGWLVESSAELGPKLGPILFQTPPWLKKDAALLKDFVALLPADGPRAAFEFRSTSWFDDEVFGILEGGGAALVAADTGDPDKDPPLVATAPFGYARLRREAYDEGDLEAWAERLSGQGWDDLWVFFKHEDEGAGPRLAGRFREMLRG